MVECPDVHMYLQVFQIMLERAERAYPGRAFSFQGWEGVANERRVAVGDGNDAAAAGGRS